MKGFMRWITLVMLIAPFPLAAEDWYAGTTFVNSGETHACVIVRFKAVDGSYTLSQADALYNTISGLLVNQDLGEISIENVLPSENQQKGITGEGLANAFLSSGTGACLVDGEPVDALGFVSTFRCEYQNENQMCFRLYVDTGETDLSGFGIPQGPAAVGGIFVKREVWDAVFAFILNNSSLLGSLVTDDLNSDAGLDALFAPLRQQLDLVLPTQ